ncbi:Syncrip [Carabus blaptoides fortunei]
MEQQYVPAPITYLDVKPVNERLLQLSMKTGYDCIQTNGQRRYGPPPNWTGPPPERGSEVFVGHLPRDCFEDELVPMLETVSQIYEMRLMMNFTGYNRGFAFVTFFNQYEAWRVVQALDEFEIRPGCKLALSKSINNCRLYVGGIPHDKTKADVWEEMRKIAPAVKDVIMYPSVEERSKNRGFFFIEFESHRSAAMAKRLMVPGTIRLWDKDVVIDWADPEPDVNPLLMSSVTKLFVRNLNRAVDNEYLKKILIAAIPSSSITRIYIASHYAFLHFDNRLHAQIAKELLSRVVVEGEMLEVQWARPRYFKKQPVVSNTCKSVPPRMRKFVHQDHFVPKVPLPVYPVYPCQLRLGETLWCLIWLPCGRTQRIIQGRYSDYRQYITDILYCINLCYLDLQSYLDNATTGFRLFGLRSNMQSRNGNSPSNSELPLKVLWKFEKPDMLRFINGYYKMIY